MSRPEADHFGPGLVQARGGPLRAWARSRPKAARFRPGSVEARGGPFWAWARPGPSRFSAGLERSRPTAARPGSGRIQARGRLLRAWFRPGPRRTGPGLDPSRCQGSSSKPCWSKGLAASPPPVVRNLELIFPHMRACLCAAAVASAKVRWQPRRTDMQSVRQPHPGMAT